MTENALRIVKLSASNVKRLRAVAIEPNGNLVVVSGQNGQGKSSVLDSIWYALGGASSHPAEPIHRGEKSAKIELDLGEIVVTRRFTANGTTLVVENADGARFSSPQAMLDKLVGSLSFDPLAFSRLPAKRQAETLRELVGIDFRELDRRRDEAFAERTQHNREAKALAARLEAMPEVAPDAAPCSIEEILARRSEADRRNRDRQSWEVLQETTRRRIEAIEEELAAARERLAMLAEKLQAAPPEEDLATYDEQIRQAEKRSAILGQIERRKDVAACLEKETARAQALTEEIEEIDAEKNAALESARWPVEGLAFSEEGVTYQGLPFDQASAAEQIRVSVAIGAALNPLLRVLTVRDASLLDERSLAALKATAVAHDMQVWLERIEQDATTTVVIEDGRVAGVSDAE